MARSAFAIVKVRIGWRLVPAATFAPGVGGEVVNATAVWKGAGAKPQLVLGFFGDIMLERHGG